MKVQGREGFRQIITNLFSLHRLEWLHPAAPLYSRPIRATAGQGGFKHGSGKALPLETIVRKIVRKTSENWALPGLAARERKTNNSKGEQGVNTNI